MITKEQSSILFKEFLEGYDAETKDALWLLQSSKLRNFWISKIMTPSVGDLNDAEIDEIVRILDRSGKGNTKSSEAVARTMIAQGAWRRMFNQIKNDTNLSQLLNNLFGESDKVKQASCIDQLYKVNEKNKNNLTGKSGNAINAMLAAWDPILNLSVISMNDRKRVLDFFQMGDIASLEKLTMGNQMIASNDLIMVGFKALGFVCSARTLTVFLYSPQVKSLWKPEEENHESLREDGQNDFVHETESKDPALFYLERQLEDFLIENWDKTELGEKYDLIEENGEMVSQQYPTSVGPIDILAQDKKSHQYVVIELKRNQTSDDTVGQLARYMGWLEENKTNNQPTKGIIIAGRWDEKLYYALKKIKDTEIYLYQVDFKLREFKKG